MMMPMAYGERSIDYRSELFALEPEADKRGLGDDEVFAGNTKHRPAEQHEIVIFGAASNCDNYLGDGHG